GIILAFEHKIVHKNFAYIDKAFFTLNGYLSIIFFIFIWVDLVTLSFIFKVLKS
ncbi:hypothetical protein VWO27_10205, partial [Campylobacter coli]|nr:hypothetical protein [Campylobacter coli]